jgi:superfamily II DNA helicase RecQ
LNQSITRTEYDSPLVCALAVLGVREDGWKGAEQYPPVLSAVIKVARFMVVQQALELSGPSHEAEFDNDSAYESDNTHPRRKGCLQFVQEMMDKFMVRGSHGPMQWMLDLRTYGLKIQYNTTSKGHVQWKGHDELLYKDLHFGMAQFRGMIHGLAAETRRLLFEELLFSSNKSTDGVPPVPWDSLRDDPTNERPGWNFLHDPRSHLPVNGETWLFNQVGRNPSIQRRFLKSGSHPGLNRRGVEGYMARVVEFREKLAVLIHIAGGQPARGPELLSIRHSNTAKGGHRNIFIEDGMVVFVTRYHKGYTVSGDVKIIHRYLPREVGELLVWYLWLVLPFQQQLEAVAWERETMSSHLWPADPSGRKWTSERLRRVLKRESGAGMGQELTIQAYRQIAIGISRKFMRASAAFCPDDDDDEDGQPNSPWDEENWASGIADAQAGHSSHVAGLVYGRAILEQAGTVTDRRIQFRMSSTDWHRFLGFQPPADDAPTSKKRKRAPFESEAEDGRMDRWKCLRQMDPTTQLKRMMGEDAEFRGVQKEAIRAIAAGESPVVAVMPTGAGKSLLFMLPAWFAQGGTTVVVVPLVALRADLTRRCRELGISCREWDNRRPPDAAAVVLVTPESAVSGGFASFLNRLRAMQRLDRIVIDECHVVLSRQDRFRKQLQQLGKLVAAETQMVLLTATLPPGEEKELYRRMYFEEDRVRLLRARTGRVNVAYQVLKLSPRKGHGGDAAVLEVVRGRMQKHKAGKTIVYCNTVGKATRLAEALGCGAYHSTAVDKERMLEAFREGSQRIIVATSSLGMGVDIADIRCVIHADRPRSLLEYAQESGRAGRDGLTCEAVVIEQEGWMASVDSERTGEEQALVRTYLWGEGGEERCRRVLLDGYLDGRTDRAGCEGGEELCDVCAGARDARDVVTGERGGQEPGEGEGEMRRTFLRQEQERSIPRARYVQRRQSEAMDMEWLRQQLQWWAGRCVMCSATAAGSSASAHHDLGQCRRPESRVAQEKVRMIEQSIRFAPYSGCFWCGVPQEVCDGWEEKSGGGFRKAADRACQFKGVLVAGVVGLALAYPDRVGERWRRRIMEMGMRSEQDIVRFLGRARATVATECNNLVGEFCWVTRAVAERRDGGWEALG